MAVKKSSLATATLQAPETFAPEYDADGNQTKVQTSTGIWSVEYNAENRPIHFTRTEEDGSTTQIACTYDHMGRRATKKVTTNGTVTLHRRYLYRGYLQIAACDQTRSGHPCLWHLTWDPTQPVATRPLALQKDGAWYTYGWDLTKNICEVYKTNGGIGTAYTYTPYGEVAATGAITQPIQWSSEHADTELGLIYYNYRHYNPSDGRFLTFDPSGKEKDDHSYIIVRNFVTQEMDFVGLMSVNDVLELVDQTETARVKNILSGIGAATLAAACLRANNRVKESILKGDMKKAQEWDRKKSIICKLASEAARACL